MPSSHGQHGQHGVRLFAALVLLLLSVANVARAELIDRIVAVVNGSIITLSDVHAAMQFGLAGEGANDRAAVVERLIERRLMMSDVERYGPPDPKPEQIAAALAATRARFSSPAAFDAALAATGVTVEQLRQHKRDELRIEAFIQQRYGFAPDRRGTLVAEWIAGLRRRADISVLPQ